MDSSDHPQAGPQQDEPDKKPDNGDAKAKPVDTGAQEQAGQDRADGGGYT